MTLSTIKGRSIRLYLVDGDARGLVCASVPNWTGSVVIGRNADLPSLLSRPEAQRAGVYVLYGEGVDEFDNPRIYIGQAQKLADRLRTHAREKDFWEIAALISTSDPNFSAGHFLALESRLIAMAHASGRAAVENVQQPIVNAGGLGEADQADVENFLTQTLLVLPVMGIRVLEPLGAKGSARENHARFEIAVDRGTKTIATAVERDSAFIVLEGSLALRDAGHRTNYAAGHKRELTEKDILVPADDSRFYRFARDCSFSSPSRAAAVVLDRNSNGRTEWKVAGTGETYHEWQEAQVVESPVSED